MPTDLSLLDRGYNAFWLYALYNQKKQFVCMRAKINQGLVFKQFVDCGKAQAIISIEANKSSREACQSKGLPSTALTLRLVRIELDNNEVEVLITNLIDEQIFPAKEFKALYHLRWGVEENYKRLKQWVEIENFSGKSALSVKQDFYAKVLTTNLISMASNAAQVQVDKATRSRKHAYQVNFAQAVSKMKNTLVELLMLSGFFLRKRLKALTDYMACTFEPVRKGRINYIFLVIKGQNKSMSYRLT